MHIIVFRYAQGNADRGDFTLLQYIMEYIAI